MFIRTSTILIISLVLAAAGAVGARAADGPAPPQNSKPAPDAATRKAEQLPAQASPAQASPSVGMEVFIDPTTGKIVEPTDAQIGALSPADPLRAKPRALITVFPGPNGGVGAILTPDSFSYAVATRTPQGEIAVDCVTGDLNAERAVIGPLSGSSQETPKTKAASDEKK